MTNFPEGISGMDTPQRLSHAYIISAPEEAGEATARELCAELLCSSGGKRPCGMCSSCQKVRRGIHPDVIFTRRQTGDKGQPKREIYVEQIREIIDSSATLPNEAETKVYVICEAGLMNPSAQNALLKLLEEPPRFDAFILIAENPRQLLETVRSRCVLKTPEGAEKAEDAPTPPESEEYVRCAEKGDAAALLRLMNSAGEKTGAELMPVIDGNVALLTGILAGRRVSPLEPETVMRLIRLQETARSYLRQNVGVKHVCGLLSVLTIDLK